MPFHLHGSRRVAKTSGGLAELAVLIWAFVPGVGQRVGSAGVRGGMNSLRAGQDRYVDRTAIQREYRKLAVRYPCAHPIHLCLFAGDAASLAGGGHVAECSQGRLCLVVDVSVLLTAV